MAGGGDDDGEVEEEEDGDFGEAEIAAAPGAATDKERWRGALDGRAL